MFFNVKIHSQYPEVYLASGVQVSLGVLLPRYLHWPKDHLFLPKGSSQVADGRVAEPQRPVLVSFILCCLMAARGHCHGPGAWLGCTGQNKCPFLLGCGYPGLEEVLTSTTQCKKASPPLPTPFKCGHNTCSHSPKAQPRAGCRQGKKKITVNSSVCQYLAMFGATLKCKERSC